MDVITDDAYLPRSKERENYKAGVRILREI